MSQTLLHNSVGVDSLGETQLCDADIISRIGDSVAVSEVPSVVDSVAVREVMAVEMFGGQSQSVEGFVVAVQQSQTLISDTLFQLLAVVMLFAVGFFIARHRHRIAVMFMRMLKGRLPDDYSSGRRDEVLTRTFLHSSSFIGAMLIALFLVKYAPSWLPESLTPASERWSSLVATGVALLGVGAVIGFEQMLLWVIGTVTRREESIGAILYLKRSYFALAAIAMSPVFLLGVLASERFTDVWNIILFVEGAILALMFLKETLAFFIDKKIPIFHWILYLCTVEVFPLSLIWALITRS